MDTIAKIISELIRAWKEGSLLMKVAIIFAIISGAIALGINVVGKVLMFNREYFEAVSTIFTIIGGIIALIIVGVRRSIELTLTEEKVERAEQRAQENPDQPTAAWDLARIKLESYLNRNLNQVRSIFWLTAAVMIVGFMLIAYGVKNAFENPELLQPALLSAISGILVNFIGATFLVLYKSTMEQAKEYVSILERINAVGMSVQVLEKLEGADNNLKHTTTADLAKQLLSLYKK
jgi:hypothetical protein